MLLPDNYETRVKFYDNPLLPPKLRADEPVASTGTPGGRSTYQYHNQTSTGGRNDWTLVKIRWVTAQIRADETSSQHWGLVCITHNM